MRFGLQSRSEAFVFVCLDTLGWHVLFYVKMYKLRLIFWRHQLVSNELFQEEGVHIHGGESGFQYKLWEVDRVEEGENPSVTLSYTSEHLEEGYPGKLQVQAKFTLTEKDEIKISFSKCLNVTDSDYSKVCQKWSEGIFKIFDSFPRFKWEEKS